MARYARDPYWLAAKYAGACKCGKQIRKGDRAWYWPSSRTIECETCGSVSSARFEAECFDEAAYGGSW